MGSVSQSEVIRHGQNVDAMGKVLVALTADVLLHREDSIARSVSATNNVPSTTEWCICQ
jgi:hypothetical protein